MFKILSGKLIFFILTYNRLKNFENFKVLNLAQIHLKIFKICYATLICILFI